MQGVRVTPQGSTMSISTTRAQVHIHTPKPRMRIRTTRAQMSVERRSPEFRVNRRRAPMPKPAPAPAPIATDLYVPESAVGAGRSADPFIYGARAITGLSAVTQMSSEGLHRPQKAQSVAQTSAPKTEFDLDSLTPQIEWDMGYSHVSWEPGEIIIEWDMSGDMRPQITVDPHTIEIRFTHAPAVRIRYDPDFFERHTKRKFDKKI